MTRSRSRLDAGLLATGALLAGVLVVLAWVQIDWSRGQADLERTRLLARVQAAATLWGAELERSLRTLQESASEEYEPGASDAWGLIAGSPHWRWFAVLPTDSTVAPLSGQPIEALNQLSIWLEWSGVTGETRFLHPVLINEPKGSGGWAIFPVSSERGPWTAGLIPLPELMAAVAPATWEKAGVDSSDVRVAVTLGGRRVWPLGDESIEGWEGRVDVSVSSGVPVTSHEVYSPDVVVSPSGDRTLNTVVFGPIFGPGSADAEALAVHATPAQGSVEALTKSRRRRDLGMSMMLLLAAGGAGGLLVLTSHRARVNARRQALFAATVSHELRTPLAGLRGALENLRDGIGDPEAYGDILESQLMRLEAVSEDALLSAGGGDTLPPVEAVSLAEIAEEAVSMAGAEAKIDVDVPEEAVVSAPRAALIRAVSNLVTNAQRHGRPPVRLAVRRDRSHWLLEVSDRGPGLGPDAGSVLF